MSEAKSATQAEPSMEEILASIRRIISEEGTEPEGASEGAPESAPESALADPADEVLELTDIVEEPAPVPTPAPAATADSYSQADIDAIMNGFDEPQAAEAEPAAPTAEAEPAPEPEAEPVRPAPVLRAVETASPMPDIHRLVSDATADAATAAFAGIAGVRRQAPPSPWPIGAGNTVEDLVREMLRPMLKEWLDANLPSMVERLVRQEIERIARNADAA